MLRTFVLIGAGAALLVAPAAAADWITAPSRYTHSPETGERVAQYAPIGPFYTNPQRDFLRSGYRHTRSSIRVGDSIDNLHVVEAWGAPVRPYGEWKFPYRPYSVPYDLWGAPYGGLGRTNLFTPGFPPPYGGRPRTPPVGAAPFQQGPDVPQQFPQQQQQPLPGGQFGPT